MLVIQRNRILESVVSILIVCTLELTSLRRAVNSLTDLMDRDHFGEVDPRLLCLGCRCISLFFFLMIVVNLYFVFH